MVCEVERVLSRLRGMRFSGLSLERTLEVEADGEEGSEGL